MPPPRVPPKPLTRVSVQESPGDAGGVKDVTVPAKPSAGPSVVVMYITPPGPITGVLFGSLRICGQPLRSGVSTQEPLADGGLNSNTAPRQFTVPPYSAVP